MHFSLYDNPQKEIIKNINKFQVFINIAIYVFPPPVRKIITLRDSLSGEFKESQALTLLQKITNLEWEKWKEKGIIIRVK